MQLDPTVIQAARKVYAAYLNIYSKFNKQPFGVVMNKETFKGQLIFRNHPILLPGEYFIPIHHIENPV